MRDIAVRRGPDIGLGLGMLAFAPLYEAEGSSARPTRPPARDRPRELHSVRAKPSASAEVAALSQTRQDRTNRRDAFKTVPPDGIRGVAVFPAPPAFGATGRMKGRAVHRVVPQICGRNTGNAGALRFLPQGGTKESWEDPKNKPGYYNILTGFKSRKMRRCLLSGAARAAK